VGDVKTGNVGMKVFPRTSDIAHIERVDAFPTGPICLLLIGDTSLIALACVGSRPSFALRMPM
jgi:hypothetical protein